MSGYDSIERRLSRLETIYKAPERCPTCGDHPFRVVYLDEETDQVLEESLPGAGCPACGRAIYRELAIVLDAAEYHADRGGADAR